MNKTIWSYWDNNNNNDNLIIENCIKTWYKFNNYWNIIILSNDNIEHYVKNIPKEINNFSIQSKTDYYRIYLLFHYGGAWLDMSIFLNISLDYFIKDNENKCILFTEKFDNSDNVYCNWMIICLYKNNLVLKLCLNEFYEYIKDSEIFINNCKMNHNNIFLIYTNWCNKFNNYINEIDKSTYINTHFYFYLILLKVINNNFLDSNIIFLFDALKYGRYHKKFSNNFENIIEIFKYIDIELNNFIKLGSAERVLINNIIKNHDYNKNSFIDNLISF